MGQYLATGLTLKCSTEKANLQKYKITPEILVYEMKNQLFFAPEIYDFTETDSSYVFTLQPSVLETYLIPFLEKFYPYFYDDNSEDDYKQLINKLKSTTADEWIKVAERKSYVPFQIDKYAHGDTVYFEQNFKPTARFNYYGILFTIEGKIMMECYGKHFHFFQYCVQQTFFEFPIAKAIRVYITG